jgi:hypothetical protein
MFRPLAPWMYWLLTIFCLAITLAGMHIGRRRLKLVGFTGAVACAIMARKSKEVFLKERG